MAEIMEEIKESGREISSISDKLNIFMEGRELYGTTWISESGIYSRNEQMQCSPDSQPGIVASPSFVCLIAITNCVYGIVSNQMKFTRK